MITKEEAVRTAKLLEFVADRLVCVYRESELLDYIRSCREMAAKLKRDSR